MMSFRFCQIALLVLAFGVGCQRHALPTSGAEQPKILGKTEPGEPAAPAAQLPFLVAKISKTPCFGTCPVFEAEVISDGKVFWRGKKHVARLGNFEASASKSMLSELSGRAEALGFFSFERQYPANGRRITDFPTTTSYLHWGKNERRVEDNFDAPLALQEFEKFFAEWLEQLAWQPSGGN